MEDQMENQDSGQKTVGPLDHWWTEGQLCFKFGLKVHDGGRSPVISSWIRRGLKYALIGRRRFFFETYVDDFLKEMAEEDRHESLSKPRSEKTGTTEASSDEF
jgi:hypothetical protein